MSNILNIAMDQGSSLRYTFTLIDQDNLPIDLTSYDARLQIRRTYGDTSVLVNCTLANNKLSKLSNSVILNLLPTDTSLIRFNAREDDTLECVYDLEIISATGVVSKPAKGTFTINREVTR